MEEDIYMGIVARKIQMYSEYVPAITGKRTWRYQVLGHYDGMDVGQPLCLDNTRSFQQIFDEHIRDNKPRDYAVQTYFGLHDDDGMEERFWNQAADFTFVVFMQFRKKEISKYNQWLERSENAASDGLYVRAYYTLDYNDSILVIKSKTYKTGMHFIVKLHQNTDGFCPFEIGSSYTVLAFERDSAGKTGGACGNSEIIDRVELRIIESSQGSAGVLYEKLKQCLKNEKNIKFGRYLLFGTDDEAIMIENISCGSLFRLYADDTGILRNSNEITQKFAAAITTKLMFDMENEISFGEKQESNTGSRVFCDALIQYIESYYEGQDTMSKLAEKNTLLKIANALGKIEYARNKNGGISEYNFFTLFLPFYVFTVLHFIEGKTTNEYFDFLTYFNICTQNFDKPDRVFLQTADFNTRYFEMQTKYITLYSAYIYQLKKILNKESGNRYEFVLCPGMNKRTQVKEFYRQENENYRLYEVDMAETRMYDMNDMFCILGHEVAHFVGTRIRSRKNRYRHMLRMNAHAIIIEIQNCFRRAGYGDEVCTLEIWKEYEDKFTNWIGQYIARKANPEYWRHALGSEMYGEMEEIVPYYIEEFRKYWYYTDNMEDSFKKEMTDMLRQPNIFNDIIWELFKLHVGRGEEKYSDKNRYIDDCRGLMQNIVDVFTGEKEETSAVFHINNVLDTELYLLKEAYADLISILCLHLSMKEYLNTIVNETLNMEKDIKELRNTIVIARVALVMSVMSYSDEESEDYYRWTDDDILNEAEIQELIILQNDALEFREMYIGHDMPHEPDFEICDGASIIFDQKFLIEIISYLLYCRKSFYGIIELDTLKKIQRFKNLADCTDAGSFYAEIMDLLVDYENSIYKELSDTAGEIDERIQEEKTDETDNGKNK